ncbi:alanine aminotransferase 1-like [Armigeres subalbatus]|uniref:alanine aminotransferase 1-like n=1 Tax=Armigeres subalbatus TaxID=124917 RepID=UPI002ED48A3B
MSFGQALNTCLKGVIDRMGVLSTAVTKAYPEKVAVATASKPSVSRKIRNLPSAAATRIAESSKQTYEPRVKLDNINPAIVRMEYVVRGEVLMRAGVIEKELEQGIQKPFKEVIRASIGDCHAMGQQPITFLRQVLGLITYPPLFNDSTIPEDAKERARTILSGCVGNSVGSYTDSNGIEIIRRHVAQYIQKRDGGVPADPNNIILSSGATGAIKSLMSLFRCSIGDKLPGVMTPIPQYPMYSATISELEMSQICYHLDEERGWGLDILSLQQSIAEAKKTCAPRILVVINPGNPTGQVLSRKNIESIIRFAYSENLVIFADEVYQYNVYDEGSEFHSFKKVLMEMGAPFNQMELCSFMSCSKGYLGECGIRGGYVEVVNMCPEVKAMLLKSISALVCASTIGQACMDVMVNPPKPGEPSYELFIREKNAVLASLKERARMVAETFNSIEGFSCNPVQGAMYAFPRIRLPQKAIEAARRAGQEPDVFYVYQLLEQTGICIVPGSGFGQKPDTYHIRSTILPQPEKLKEMLDTLRVFHEKFLRQYE